MAVHQSNHRYGEHMRGLRWLAGGLVLTIVDVRVDGFDLVPDPVGWLLGLLALLPLRVRDRAFGWAAAGCALGLLVSLPDWLAPQDGLLPTLSGVALLVVVVATCTGITATSPSCVVVAGRVRAWSVATAVVLAVVSVVGAALDDRDVLVPIVLVAAIAVVAVTVWFLWLLVKVSGEPSPGAASATRAVPSPP